MAKKKATKLMQRLFDTRTRLGLTQGEAAAKLRVTRRAWIGWETNGKKPSPAMLLLLELFCDRPELF